MKPTVSGSESIRLFKGRCAGRRAPFASLAEFARLTCRFLQALQNLQGLRDLHLLLHRMGLLSFVGKPPVPSPEQLGRKGAGPVFELLGFRWAVVEAV